MNAVSMLSRNTARNARITTAREPISRAWPIRSRSSLAMPREALRIQKIIQVTKPTARIDITPPMVSCAVNERAVSAVTNCSSPQAAAATARAAPTPIQTSLRRSRCPDLTRKVARMLTTSEASSPSRSPIR